jgi:ankyrin repeat protein
MTSLQEEPSIFKLIRNTEVSIDAVRLYLEHYPKRLKLPVYQNETVLSVAVNACFAVGTAELEGGDVHESLVHQLNVLQIVAEHASLFEILNGKTIFHVTLSTTDGEEDAPTALHILVANAVLTILLDQLKSKDHCSLLFVRDGLKYQLAVHMAIHHHDDKAARKLLNAMSKGCTSYEDYDFLEDGRRTPLLHESLYFSPSSKLLILILTLFPEAASKPDSDGMLPIILALERSLPARKLRLILEANPAALSVPTGDGDLPLHLAAMYYPQQQDVLELFIQNSPSALMTTNCHDQLPLHCAMEYQNVKDEPYALRPTNLIVVQLLSNHLLSEEEGDESEGTFDQPSTSATSCSLSSSFSALSINDTGIHTSQCKDQKTIDLAHCNSPSSGNNLNGASALYHKDCYGELPIHIACRRLTTQSFEILSWLLECYPESAAETNDFGHLPMHLLAASESHCANDDLIQECFELLWSANPNALYTPDDEGDVPLQCLVTHSCVSPVLLQCIFEKASGDGNILGSMENRLTGDLPLHTACLNGNFADHVLDPLLAFDPSAVLHYDYKGYLPFHIALQGQNKCTVAVLKKLLYRKEDSTLHSCPSYRSTLPSCADGVPALFVACENALPSDDRTDIESLDIICFLVENSPELFATSSLLV